MNPSRIEDLEIDLLFEAIFKRYGHDFRDYGRASIKRRVMHFLAQSGYKKVSEMIPRLLHEKAFFESMIRTFSISVTEMFRDPHVYQHIRTQVIPVLKTYPFIRAWNAGCATGEEAYSLAILLKEEGMLERTRLFATDFNDELIEKAKEGIYQSKKVKEFASNYQKTGGMNSFSEYYNAQDEAIAIDPSLKKNITFANHNLVTDNVFSEMHLILCRNVLIYFNKSLQDRVLKLFSESLVPKGYLCLGTRESIQFSNVRGNFKTFDNGRRIYQKER
ncbi:MAG: protein-glutamate O-methyltransferase CheR [bacterium]|nr:protein-glutamate O-methyltransferase CheR [Gammaproteobacteria bacterium]HIL95277.1 protein-glutamate O-methyltransferase CheR [Pseudomonadales bacterium]